MKQGIALPSVQALIRLHEELLDEHGGAGGIRDRAALDAALARPQQFLAYADQDHVSVVELAAALAVSLIRRHPFVDGNKRISFMALGVTLGLNHLHLDVPEREATEVMIALAAGTLDEQQFSAWVERNTFEFR
ncbi:type II toxin-antitoxin system death-on-curing family toxin [Aquibaculum arenosum]|uniref:Type II toxin-antitoxin system death-on-curing family toxin n=1 Tax=Aquibaculum arenosum TaxID=3032591 RepID=A0ABT5YMA6_9PROT|nr:type II toxin-antitoxin system death-on-curing family toxin [Fodinicurvata sp. CAU 1616]MDF2096065.1 type II toxin-antitoxin system death-on-curing family toxin [Fodinicurvata sp. CAU 1616]